MADRGSKRKRAPSTKVLELELPVVELVQSQPKKHPADKKGKVGPVAFEASLASAAAAAAVTSVARCTVTLFTVYLI